MKKKIKRQHKVPRYILSLFPNIKDVVDSDKNISVRVLRNDCKNGKRKVPSECAMAKAARRDYDADAAIIGMSFSYIVKDNKAIRFKTPMAVQKEIVSFDRHSDFAPGNYNLNKINKSSRLGSTSKNTNTKHDAKRVIHRTTGIRVMERGSSY